MIHLWVFYEGNVQSKKAKSLEFSTLKATDLSQVFHVSGEWFPVARHHKKHNSLVNKDVF